MKPSTFPTRIRPTTKLFLSTSCTLTRISRAPLAAILLAATTLAADPAPPPARPSLALKTDSKDGTWRFYPAAPDLRLRRVLLIGDSIMNGYRHAVADSLKGRATVDAWLTPITIKTPAVHDDMRTVLAQGPYDVVHFNIGLHEWPKGFIPEGQYEPLLRAYVKTIRDHAGNATLIWASTTQMTVKDKPAELDPENNSTIVERNAIAARVMKENGIAVDDLYSLMSDKLALAKGDRFHWTKEGVAVQASAVSGVIGAVLDQKKRIVIEGRVNYDEAKVGDLPLPPVLTAADGSKVSTREDWEKKRRPEVLDLFRDHVYGRAPAVAVQPKFEVTATKRDALGGLATRKLIHISLPQHPQWPGMDVMLHLPNSARGAVPVFCGLNFDGNHAVSAEPDVPLSTRWMRESRDKAVVNHRSTEATRGIESSRWQLERVLRRGFAVATAYYGDIEPDHPEGWKEGLRAALSPQGADTGWKDGDWGAIGAWAWGLSRVLDYLETDPAVNARQAAVIGHSRLGKTALWAGATDPRWALVVSNNSGEGGAALMRRHFGETTWVITRAFPHWFTAKYTSYVDNAAACPVDQHMLIALMAPRPVYIASAAEDEWADPKGEFLSGFHAGPVYALFDKAGLGTATAPPIDQPVGDFIRYHNRTGKHTVTDYDWDQYLSFAERHFSYKHDCQSTSDS
jgi:hypothetical protein